MPQRIERASAQATALAPFDRTVERLHSACKIEDEEYDYILSPVK